MQVAEGVIMGKFLNLRSCSAWVASFHKVPPIGSFSPLSSGTAYQATKLSDLESPRWLQHPFSPRKRSKLFPSHFLLTSASTTWTTWQTQLSPASQESLLPPQPSKLSPFYGRMQVLYLHNKKRLTGTVVLSPKKEQVLPPN